MIIGSIMLLILHLVIETALIDVRSSPGRRCAPHYTMYATALTTPDFVAMLVTKF